MSWTLCTSGSAILKAGANVNATIVNYGSNKTFIDQLSDEAESQACDLARYDVITNYATLTTNGKAILAQFCEAVVAQNLILYDADAIGRTVASIMYNALDTQKQEAVAILTDNNKKIFLGIT